MGDNGIESSHALWTCKWRSAWISCGGNQVLPGALLVKPCGASYSATLDPDQPVITAEHPQYTPLATNTGDPQRKSSIALTCNRSNNNKYGG